MLLRKIKEMALDLIDEEFTLIDFSFALPYTYVLIEGERGKSLGVAMTLPEEVGRYRVSITEPSLEGFIKRLDSINIIERTLGLAAVNALSQYHLDTSNVPDVDVTRLLTEDIKKVAVIGNMPPVVDELRKRFEVLVFERNPKLWDRDTYSDALEYWLLPEVDAVIVSGSAILNGTLDMILDRAKRAEIIVLTGPTAQLLPDFLRGSGVTHLAAMKVVDVEKALTRLKLGSFRGFEEGSRKYVVEV